VIVGWAHIRPDLAALRAEPVIMAREVGGRGPSLAVVKRDRAGHDVERLGEPAVEVRAAPPVFTAMSQRKRPNSPLVTKPGATDVAAVGPTISGSRSRRKTALVSPFTLA
jgi:hypothetical protein